MGVAASVPEDALDKAACWLKKDDLLRLREISPHGRDTARRAIARKAIPHVRTMHVPTMRSYHEFIPGSAHEPKAAPQAIEAMGRVFGAGCACLMACGESVSAHAALWSFVKSTNGGLETLALSLASVSSELLVAICRASPNLLRLNGPNQTLGYAPTSDQAILAIAAACPKLEIVSLYNGTDLSPAESWQPHFPRLKSLVLYDGKSGLDTPPYRPTLLEKISVAARSDFATALVLEGCHIFPDVIEAIVGTPVGDRLTSMGSGQETSVETILEPDALLAAARGFPCLTELWISNSTNIPNPGWFVELAGIRTFETMIIESRHVTDSQVVAACSQNPLVRLDLFGVFELTRDAIDGIISSQSAATLRDLVIAYCEPLGDDDESFMYVDCIQAADILRLVRACPHLSDFNWQREYSNDLSQSAQDTEAEIAEILKLRGGKFSSSIG